MCGFQWGPEKVRKKKRKGKRRKRDKGNQTHGFVCIFKRCRRGLAHLFSGWQSVVAETRLVQMRLQAFCRVEIPGK